MFTPKISKLRMFWLMVQAYTVGLRTPHGFRLRHKAYSTLMGLSEEVKSLRVRYDFALKRNEKQSQQVIELTSQVAELTKDAKQLSVAVKELLVKPNELSESTREVVRAHLN